MADPTNSEIALQRLVQALRHKLRDFKEVNRLIAGEESDDRFLTFALLEALDDYNATPPVTRHSLWTMPATSILLQGAVISVLESVGLLQTRNQLSYRDGDGILPLADKTPLLMNWLSMFRSTYETKKSRNKIAHNIENAWGDGVGSEYGWIAFIYGQW